ncbi:hypothetical protein Dimus_011836, partial [Dionaea muscipula]
MRYLLHLGSGFAYRRRQPTLPLLDINPSSELVQTPIIEPELTSDVDPSSEPPELGLRAQLEFDILVLGM